MSDRMLTAWPTKYYLPSDENKWTWVKLRDLCELLKGVRNAPDVTPNGVVGRFAHLAKILDGEQVPYFWFARDIRDKDTIEVEWRRPEEAKQFSVRYNHYFDDALVPDGWAKDVFKAATNGAWEVVVLDGKPYSKDFFGNLKAVAA